MNLHEAEWIAGELAAFAGAAVALVWVWVQHKARETGVNDPERPETTEYSSLNDD